MPQVEHSILHDLADVLSLTAQVCERARTRPYDVHLKRILCGAHNLLGATLDVIEDKLTAIEPNTLTFLTRITKALLAQPDFELGASELLEQVNQYLSTEAGSIFVLDKATEELVLKYASSPVASEVIGLRMPVGIGVVGWVVQYNEDLIVPSTGLDPRFFSGVDKKTGFVTKSILGVPISQSGQRLGAIEMLNKTTGSFNDDDVKLLQAIAGVVGQCIVDPRYNASAG